MKAIKNITVVLALTTMAIQASEIALGRLYIPVDPVVDRPVEVVCVPFYTSGPYPEIFYSAITEPYILKQGNQTKGGDINLASLAGISLLCEGSAGHFYITWDFTKANFKLVTKELIEGLLLCIEKTAGKTTIYSKFKGDRHYLSYRKIIEARFPQEEKGQTRKTNKK